MTSHNRPTPDEEQAVERDTVAEEQTAQAELLHTIEDKAERHLTARHKGKHSLWYGLGTFGVVGWSVAVPTLIGAAIGLWLDLTWPSAFSWTLALLLAGVTAGIFNAWFWVSQEQRDIEAEKVQRRQLRAKERQLHTDEVEQEKTNR